MSSQLRPLVLLHASSSKVETPQDTTLNPKKWLALQPGFFAADVDLDDNPFEYVIQHFVVSTKIAVADGVS